MSEDLAKEFATALGRKDRDGLKALLRPDVEFRALTPGRFWEADSADAVVDDIILGKWFEPSDEIVEVTRIDTEPVGARQRVGYRLAVRNQEGRFLVEQQAYLQADGDRIGWLRIMCAGYQPVVAQAG